MPRVVIANRLRDGVVVFLAQGENWSETIDDCRLAADAAEAQQMMEIAQRAIGAQLVVGPELIEVERSEEGIVPKKRRERIRATGPSIRTDLGKQADG